MRYTVKPHPTGSGYQIVDTTTNTPVAGKSRLVDKTFWGNPHAAGMQCNAMNRADKTGKPAHVEPYRNPHFGF